MLERGAVFERAFAGSLDDWAVGDGIAEGDAEFDHACAGVNRREDDLARGGKIWIAASYVGD